MTTILNASPTNGLVQTADGSGVLKVQSNGVTTNALAWVNFNGTGTVAIRSSYNVSSITDNGTGLYTVNFTNALTDANYVPILGCPQYSTANNTVAPAVYGSGTVGQAAVKTTSALQVSWSTVAISPTYIDPTEFYVAIFGN